MKMLKKTMILGMILTVLMILSVYTVNAEDTTVTMIDSTDDVFKFNSNDEDLDDLETVDFMTNVDITKLEYKQEGQIATITLTVKGEIEDRGSLADTFGIDEADFTGDYVVYMFELYTYYNYYSLVYCNQEVNITNGEEYLDPVSFSVDDDKLTIVFNLLDEDDSFESIAAITTDWNIVLFVGDIYMDIAPDEENFEASIKAPSKANTDENLQFIGQETSDYDIIGWSWDFGDGNVSSAQNPTHLFGKEGTYQVTLTVTDSNLNTDTVTLDITVSDSTDTEKKKYDENQIQPLLIFSVIIAIIVIAGVVVLFRIVKNK